MADNHLVTGFASLRVSDLDSSFQPHRNSSGYPLKLYRVYDSLSQSRFVLDVGFEASKRSSSTAYEHRITQDTLSKHLDWFDPDPSSFISMYDNPYAALREATRRIQRPFVYDQRRGYRRRRGTVRIAIIDMNKLDREGVYYFNRREIFDMLDIPSDSLIRRRFGRKEWMAMDWIPFNAVEARFKNMGAFREYVA